MGIRCIGVVALLFVAAGCGGSLATIHGTVTFDDTPLDGGYISFVPQSGEGPTGGSVVAKGSFKVKNLAPGSYVINVTSINLVPPGDDSGQPRSDAPGSNPKAVPADAEGNGAVIEVKSGSQDLKVELKSKKK